MFILVLLAIAPVILIAYLLGAGWGLAILIGLSTPFAALIGVAIVSGVLVLAEDIQRKRRWRKNPRHPRNRKGS
jgi:hypothetical protein